jgi:hypothetical protein
VHDALDDPLPILDRLCKSYDHFNNAEAVLVDAQLVEVVVDLLEDKSAFFPVEGVAAEHLPYDVGALLVLNSNT